MKKLSINGFSGRVFRSEKGQALGEYAVMLGLLLAMLFLARAVGRDSKWLFQRIIDTFQ